MPSLTFSRNSTNQEAALTVTAAITGSTPGINYTILGAASIDPIAKRFQITFPANALTTEIFVEPTTSLVAPEQFRATVIDADQNDVDPLRPYVELTLQPVGAAPILTASPNSTIEGNADDMLLKLGTGDPDYTGLLQPLFFGTNSSRIVGTGAGLKYKLTGTELLPTLDWHSATQNPDLILLSNPPIVELNQVVTSPDYYNSRYFRASVAAIQPYMAALNLRYLVAANYLVANPANQEVSGSPPGYALICLQRGDFSAPDFAATTAGLFGEDSTSLTGNGSVYAGNHHLGFAIPIYESISFTKYVYGFYIQIDMLNPSSTWFVDGALASSGGS
jgi:hypothetical protein